MKDVMTRNEGPSPPALLFDDTGGIRNPDDRRRSPARLRACALHSSIGPQPFFPSSSAVNPALTIIACDSPVEHPAALPLLQAASGVVLVVALGSRLDTVRKVVDLAGRDKVLATVSVG